MNCLLKSIVAVVAIGMMKVVAAEEPAPLIHAHAHNDYQHKRPLYEALEHGFCSIEADIHLVSGKLLVAHDLKDCRPERTLEALYLEPLADRVRQNGGRVYPNGPSVTLWIDVKLDDVHNAQEAEDSAERIYNVLRLKLQKYEFMLSKSYRDRVETNAISIVITGGRPQSMLADYGERIASYDGRLTDLNSKLSSSQIPVISDSWSTAFQWHGNGEIPGEEKRKLVDFVKQAHKTGRRIRFWAAPDKPAVWKELEAAGVDLISTDDLEGVAKFLHEQPYADASR
jgi:hypothetical protein